MWTVEPGIYFVAPLLARARERTDVDWDRVDALLGFGGVRIEQDVLDHGRRLRSADRRHPALEQPESTATVSAAALAFGRGVIGIGDTRVLAVTAGEPVLVRVAS